MGTFVGDESLSVSPSAAPKPQKEKAIKRGDKISGTVSDAHGPLLGATVIEANEEGRTVGYAITDINGHFTLKVKNPHQPYTLMPPRQLNSYSRQHKTRPKD